MGIEVRCSDFSTRFFGNGCKTAYGRGTFSMSCRSLHFADVFFRKNFLDVFKKKNVSKLSSPQNTFLRGLQAGLEGRGTVILF